MMTDNELMAARLARITTPEHLLTVIEKYAAKWHALEDAKKTSGDHTFTAGRQTGYVEVLSTLLGVNYGQVRDMLHNNQL